MASCSYNYTGSGLNQTAILEVVEQSYSIVNNSSVVRWTLTVSAAGSSTWCWTHLHAKVNGSWVYYEDRDDTGGFPSRPGSVSGTMTIPHNQDGTKSITFSIDGWFYTSGAPKSASGSLTLTNIPRASTMTFPTFTAGASGTFTITKQVSTYTHSLQYPIGTDIATDIDTAYTWTCPMSVCNEFPNSTGGTIKMRLITYNGDTQMGYKDYDVPVEVPSSVVPDFSYALSEGTASGFNRYATTLSTLRAVFNSIVGAYGSTVAQARMVLNGTEYTANVSNAGATITSNTLMIAGLNTEVTLSVTDSRGRTTTKTASINIYTYAEPQITDIDLQISTTTVVCTVNGVVEPVNNVNTKFLTITKKNVSTQVVTTVLSRTSLTDYDFSKAVSQTVSDIGTVSYEYTAILEDTKSSTSKTIASGIICMSRHAGGDGVTFFKEAEAAGVWIRDVMYDITSSEYHDLAVLLASDFSTSTTYYVGDWCKYNSNYYECITQTSGSWSANKWTQI